MSPDEKAADFVSLHRRAGVFIIPNPWDAASARVLQELGFEALATTSSGFAQTLGRSDGEVTLDEKMRHCEALAAATDIPVSADLENGFADDPEGVAECIRRAIQTGIVGASIEDFSGDAQNPIYEFNLAVARVAAAVDAARSCPFPFTITARAEQLLHTDFDVVDTIRRLQAYEVAGADVLFAPGLRTLDHVRQVAAAVGKPLNVLGTMLADCSVEHIGQAGAARVSVGGSLAQLADSDQFIDAAKKLRDTGDLSWAS